MYKGNNPTAINSREWLIDALLSLMEETPYPKITIKDICIRADLSRQTFYNFFDSKDDMIELCIIRCYEEMMDELKGKKPLVLSDIINSLMQTFENHHDFMSLILSHGLEDILSHTLADSICAFTEQLNPDSSGYPYKYGTAFLSGAITHTILCWFKDPEPISSVTLAELLANILSGKYYKI